MRLRRERRKRRERTHAPLGSGCVPGSVSACATLRSSRQLLTCLRQGGDVHSVDAFGLSPLFRAVMADSVDNVLALAEYGAEVNQVAMVTLRILRKAALYRINEHLGLQGATAIPFDAPFFLTPLHLAALSGSAECIQILLSNGADAHAGVSGPLPSLSGTPFEFCDRFLPQDTEQERETRLRCLAAFQGIGFSDLDKEVFRLFLHRIRNASSSTIDTRVAQIQRCESLLRPLLKHQRAFLFRNMNVEHIEQMRNTLQQMEQFQLLNERQHGGLGNALADFILYAKNSMRQKYNSL